MPEAKVLGKVLVLSTVKVANDVVIELASVGQTTSMVIVSLLVTVGLLP